MWVQIFNLIIPIVRSTFNILRISILTSINRIGASTIDQCYLPNHIYFRVMIAYSKHKIIQSNFDIIILSLYFLILIFKDIPKENLKNRKEEKNKFIREHGWRCNTFIYFRNTTYRGPRLLFKHRKNWDNKTPGITKNNKILQDKLCFESGICSINLLRFP